MKKIVIVLSIVLAIAFQANCFAKGVRVRNAVAVFETEADIESRTPCGSFNRNEIVDAYYDDTLSMDGTDYVLAIGRTFESNNAVYTKGYVEQEQLVDIYKEIRTLDELSPNEIRVLLYATGNAIHDETGVWANTSDTDLILNGYLDIQVSDHCAVVSFENVEGESTILFKVEFLFTMDEHSNGEYRTLYVEQNGRGVFGSYEPIAETEYTEKLLGVSFSGFICTD